MAHFGPDSVSCAENDSVHDHTKKFHRKIADFVCVKTVCNEENA